MLKKKDRGMKQPTRRKYYARSAIAQALRTAASELNNAIAEAEKPQVESPLAVQLRKVAKCLDNAIEAEKIYTLQRKRVKTHLERERKHIQDLIAEVTNIAILPGEKLIAKRKRKKGGADESKPKIQTNKV
jgi:replicative superfamily II helicase